MQRVQERNNQQQRQQPSSSSSASQSSSSSSSSFSSGGFALPSSFSSSFSSVLDTSPTVVHHVHHLVSLPASQQRQQQPSVVIVNNSNSTAGSSSSSSSSAAAAAADHDDDKDDKKKKKKGKTDEDSAVASIQWTEIVTAGMLLAAAGTALFYGIRSATADAKAQTRSELARAALFLTKSVFSRSYKDDVDAQSHYRRLVTIWQTLALLDSPSTSTWKHPVLPWSLIGSGAMTGAISILGSGALTRSVLGYSAILLPATGAFIWVAQKALAWDEPTAAQREVELINAIATLQPYIHAPSAPPPPAAAAASFTTSTFAASTANDDDAPPPPYEPL